MNDHLKDENALLTRFSGGDETAFRELFDLLIQPLCYFGRQLTNDKEEAEDIASLAFHKLWERHAGFTTMAGVRSFLYTTVRNHCLNYLKHRKVVSGAQQQLLHLLEKEDAWADARMVQADLVQKVYAEIEALPPRLREIVRLSFVEGLTTAEIAERLQMGENHVRADKSRAIVMLRNVLAKKNLLHTALLLWLFGG